MRPTLKNYTHVPVPPYRANQALPHWPGPCRHAPGNACEPAYEMRGKLPPRLRQSRPLMELRAACLSKTAHHKSYAAQISVHALNQGGAKGRKCPLPAFCRFSYFNCPRGLRGVMCCGAVSSSTYHMVSTACSPRDTWHPPLPCGSGPTIYAFISSFFLISLRTDNFCVWSQMLALECRERFSIANILVHIFIHLDFICEKLTKIRSKYSFATQFLCYLCIFLTLIPMTVHDISKLIVFGHWSAWCNYILLLKSPVKNQHCGSHILLQIFENL